MTSNLVNFPNVVSRDFLGGATMRGWITTFYNLIFVLLTRNICMPLPSSPADGPIPTRTPWFISTEWSLHISGLNSFNG